MENFATLIANAAQHTFIGQIGRTPEIRYLEAGLRVATTSLAVNRPGSRKSAGDSQAYWFTVEAWNDLAPQLADTVSKGDRVKVSGMVKTNVYTSKKTGEQVTEYIIAAQELQILRQKKQEENDVPF